MKLNKKVVKNKYLRKILIIAIKIIVAIIIFYIKNSIYLKIKILNYILKFIINFISMNLISQEYSKSKDS